MKLTDDLITKFNLKENTRDTMGVSQLHKLRIFDWFEEFNVYYMFLECNILGLPIEKPDCVMLMARGPRFYKAIIVNKELMTRVTPAFLKQHVQKALDKVRPKAHGYGQPPTTR